MVNRKLRGDGTDIRETPDENPKVDAFAEAVWGAKWTMVPRQKIMDTFLFFGEAKDGAQIAKEMVDKNDYSQESPSEIRQQAALVMPTRELYSYYRNYHECLREYHESVARNYNIDSYLPAKFEPISYPDFVKKVARLKRVDPEKLLTEIARWKGGMKSVEKLYDISTAFEKAKSIMEKLKIGTRDKDE